MSRRILSPAASARSHRREPVTRRPTHPITDGEWKIITFALPPALVVGRQTLRIARLKIRLKSPRAGSVPAAPQTAYAHFRDPHLSRRRSPAYPLSRKSGELEHHRLQPVPLCRLLRQLLPKIRALRVNFAARLLVPEVAHRLFERLVQINSANRSQTAATSSRDTPSSIGKDNTSRAAASLRGRSPGRYPSPAKHS